MRFWPVASSDTMVRFVDDLHQVLQGVAQFERCGKTFFLTSLLQLNL